MYFCGEVSNNPHSPICLPNGIFQSMSPVSGARQAWWHWALAKCLKLFFLNVLGPAKHKVGFTNYFFSLIF